MQLRDHVLGLCQGSCVGVCGRQIIFIIWYWKHAILDNGLGIDLRSHVALAGFTGAPKTTLVLIMIALDGCQEDGTWFVVIGRNLVLWLQYSNYLASKGNSGRMY